MISIKILKETILEAEKEFPKLYYPLVIHSFIFNHEKLKIAFKNIMHK